MKLWSMFVLSVVVFSSVSCAEESPKPAAQKSSVQPTAQLAKSAPQLATQGAAQPAAQPQPQKSAVLNSQNSQVKVTMVELGSVNCIPCRAMAKVMDSLAILFPEEFAMRFHDVWTEQGKPYARQYGIRSIPTQVFLDASGNEIHRHEGFYPQNEIIQFLQTQGITK
jgi:thioredoxin 1